MYLCLRITLQMYFAKPLYNVIKKHLKYEIIFQNLLKNVFLYCSMKLFQVTFTTNGCNTHPLSHFIGNTFFKI